MTVHPYHLSWQKRAFDLSLALPLFLAVLPIILVLSLVVFFTAGTPIFFTQNRTGKNKKPFTIYKFRTMYQGANYRQWAFRQQNQAPEPMFKIFDDPRFVGVGKWLSRTGLDELPQLINVIKGEMSLVGPRPLPVSEVKKLNLNWDFRHQVRPGIFSEWTLSPQRHQSLSRWKKLDQLTLHQGSFSHDVRIITQTLKRLLKTLL